MSLRRCCRRLRGHALAGVLGPLWVALPTAACGTGDGPTVTHAGDQHASAARYPIVFATFLGGTGKESVRDVATDRAGNVYVTGGTESVEFPTTEGAFDRSHNGWHDVFVAKFRADGELLWSTFLGGENYDRAYAIEVGDDGSVFVAGRAGEGFPTTSGCVQAEFGGDSMPSGTYGKQDGFVAKLSGDGTRLEWATYFGVGDGSNIRDLDVDGQGSVYLAADAASDHPSRYATEGAFQTTVRGERDALVAKLAPDGSHVVWGTYIGGSGADGGAGSIRVDASGSAYLLAHTRSEDLPASDNALQKRLGGGKDLFVARLAPDGRSLVFLTYLGGSAQDFTETHGLALASDGTVYVTASTLSKDFPPAGTRGAQPTYGGSGGKDTGTKTNYPGDGFVARISADGSTLLGFTYFGGSLGEGIEGSAIDSNGNVWVSGATYSADLPVSSSAWQHSTGGLADAFVACFTPDLSGLVFASYRGGSDHDFARCIAVSPTGSVAVGGVVYSADFPASEGAHDSRYGELSDGLVFGIDPAP